MDHRLGVGADGLGRELEGCAQAKGSTADGGSKNIAGRVQNHSASRSSSVGGAIEAVDRLFRPHATAMWRYFEDQAPVGIATSGCGAVEVAVRVHRQNALRFGTVPRT